jgi:hypothetical protein
VEDGVKAGLQRRVAENLGRTDLVRAAVPHLPAHKSKTVNLGLALIVIIIVEHCDLNVILRWTTNDELIFFTTRGRDELFQQFLQFPIRESLQTKEDLEVVNTFTPGPADSVWKSFNNVNDAETGSGKMRRRRGGRVAVVTKARPKTGLHGNCTERALGECYKYYIFELNKRNSLTS